MKEFDLIILFSGGLDSSILLRLALKLGYNPYCILFDYGQKHKEELEFAEKQCKELNVPYQKLVLDIPLESKLTNERGDYKGVSQYHVPSRNLIFISIVASIAESKGIELIWYGANSDDRQNEFPDCYQEWIHALNKILDINGSISIKLEAPLLGLTKQTLLSIAELLNVEQDKIFSGYERE